MPPPNRAPPHDPFTTTSSASTTHGLRTQPSQSSLRSTASSSTSRTRQHQTRNNELFAPALSRRARVEDEVLADSSSEQEPRSRRTHHHLRRHAAGSPAGRHKRQQQQAEEVEIVKRDAQGNYLLGGCELGVGSSAAAMKTVVQEDEEEVRMEELNAYYSTLAKKYFTSGAGITTRRVEEDYERDRPDMMYCLKAEVIQKLENERWLYEPVDRLQPGIP